MTTLAVVEEILRETAVPMSVREIVERAGARLPSKSKTPDTVVARDLSMDLKKKGDGSLFARTSPGRYTLRELVSASPAAPVVQPVATVSAAPTPIAASLAGGRKPAVAASPSTATRRTDRAETDSGIAGA